MYLFFKFFLLVKDGGNFIFIFIAIDDSSPTNCGFFSSDAGKESFLFPFFYFVLYFFFFFFQLFLSFSSILFNILSCFVIISSRHLAVVGVY